MYNWDHKEVWDTNAVVAAKISTLLAFVNKTKVDEKAVVKIIIAASLAMGLRRK